MDSVAITSTPLIKSDSIVEEVAIYAKPLIIIQ
jgi:hypothetical protein